jgi:hypothetical protein
MVNYSTNNFKNTKQQQRKHYITRHKIINRLYWLEDETSSSLKLNLGVFKFVN